MSHLISFFTIIFSCLLISIPDPPQTSPAVLLVLIMVFYWVFGVRNVADIGKFLRSWLRRLL